MTRARCAATRAPFPDAMAPAPGRTTAPEPARTTAGPAAITDVVDASGSTFVPGMVDCHSHLTLPGGAHWIERIDDPPERLLAVAERNARLMTAAGVRWARDVGAPRIEDPVDGRLRALSLGVRDRWRGRPGFPHVRAAGTWLDRNGTMPGARTVTGLEPWEALGAATWRGGDLLGEPEAGVIREGGPADFSLVHGDPLSDPTALWRVWHVAWAG